MGIETTIRHEHVDHKGRPRGDNFDERGRRAVDVAAGVTRSWGRALVDSEPYRKGIVELKGAPLRENIALTVHRPRPDEVKSIFELTSGSLVAPDRQYANPTPLPRRMPRIRDLLFPASTESSLVYFLTQTVRDKEAAPVIEGNTIPESNVGYGVGEAPVGFISTFITASRQLFDDSEQVVAAIDGELTYSLQFVEDLQLLYGPGTTGYVRGMLAPSPADGSLQVTPFVAPYAVSNATPIDTILQSLVQAVDAEVMPDGIVVNGSDWLRMKGLKDTAGHYILGDPGDSDDTAPTLWGVPVVPTLAMASGIFCTGAFQTVTLYERSEVEIVVATQDSSDFQLNQVKIRAASRAALAVRRPQALILGSLPSF